jgi:Glycosyl hydrolase family 26
MKAAAAVVVMLALACALTATAAAGRRAPTPRQLGVTMPWSTAWLSDLDAYASRVGRMPAVVATTRGMDGAMLDLAAMRDVSARGAVPLVSVEPWGVSLQQIAAGGRDSWFAAAASAARSFGRPFYLRFAPEMNGRSAPWGAANPPRVFVDAWRHVHAIFAARGATNVKWVWSPNVFGGGSAVDFRPYYPGSDVVDVLALDGYNWGALDVWQTYSQVFGPSYDVLTRLDATKQVMIAETATTELGGNKASWIRSAFTREIPARTPRVRIVVWFDVNKETDWRVESSPQALSAYRSVATSSAWG